jgi:hypothetical protein
MGSIYKVTSASVGKTKNGYQIYKLQLNNSILATKLFPLRELDKKCDKLFQLYTKNNRSLEFLVGKYVSIWLNKTQYGIEFSSIVSFDAIQEFKDLLDNSKGKAFFTNMGMYEFLKRKNHSTNTDGSITLKAPYDRFNLTENNVCYPNDMKNNCLTLDNIEIIFNQFYRDKVIDNGNPDNDEKYVLTNVAIVKNQRIYHNYKSKTISDENFDVLRVGDLLTEEQYEYILQI